MKCCRPLILPVKLPIFWTYPLTILREKTMCRLDKNTSERTLEVFRFEESDRNHIFSVIDAFVAKRKIQSIM